MCKILGENSSNPKDRLIAGSNPVPCTKLVPHADNTVGKLV